MREVFPARLLLHADEAHGVVKTSLPSIAGAIGSVTAFRSVRRMSRLVVPLMLTLIVAVAGVAEGDESRPSVTRYVNVSVPTKLEFGV